MINLDHAATTPLRPEALNAMLPYFTEHAANANALYAEGRRARAAIDAARRQIAVSYTHLTLPTTPYV